MEINRCCYQMRYIREVMQTLKGNVGGRSKQVQQIKEYSAILTTSFYNKNWRILTKKRLFPKFQMIQIFHSHDMYDYVH